LRAIPEDCAVVADLGASSAYTPTDVGVLRDYLLHGGNLLLAYDPRFPVTPELSSLLNEVGLRVENGVVIDPLNHSGTDQQHVAVPYYPPHPITDQIALTVFPEARPIRLQRPVADVSITELVTTSKDSYVRPILAAADVVQGLPPVTATRLLAVAVHGIWP